jgi:hypothetical protein
MTPEQALYLSTESKHLAEITDLKAQLADLNAEYDLRGVIIAELRGCNKELRAENARLYAESTEKCPKMRMKHTEEND